jgi:WD40 repeat protein
MPSPLVAQKIAQLTGHNASVFALSSYKSPNTFISGAGDGWVVEWDVDAPEMGRLIAKIETQIFYLQYLSQQHGIIVGNMNGGVHWVNLQDSSKTANIAHHKKGVFGIIHVNGQVYTIGGGGWLTRWDIHKQRTTESLQLSHASLRCIDYSPIRNELLIGASDHNIYFVDPDSLRLKMKKQAAHENSVFAARYTPDGQRLISGGRDAMLKMWSLQDQQIICEKSIPAHWFTINSIAFHPQHNWLATASRDKTIKIWDLSGLKLLKVLEMQRDSGHVNSVNRLLWLPYQNTLVSASDDRSMILWDINYK